MITQLQLFAIPHAGGSASAYNKWKKHLLDFIRFFPIELAGHGYRNNEPLYSNMGDLISDIYVQIMDNLKGPFMIFGHSFGALLAFEVINKMKFHNDPLPCHAFFSGYQAPHIRYENEPIHRLPDQDFIHEVALLGGMPQEIINCSELMELYLPILKADYCIEENYMPREVAKCIDCDITAMGGKLDSISIDDLRSWKLYTEQDFFFDMVDGDHFFAYNPDLCVPKINKRALKYVVFDYTLTKLSLQEQL